jgi:hypothetical protein
MPFIHVYGLPQQYISDQDFLEKLEGDLITSMAKAMKVGEDICHVNFHVNALKKDRPNKMPWAYVTSGAFEGESKEVQDLKKATSDAVALTLQTATEMKYKIEVFPEALDGKHKAYLKI